ncbi:hypothetical protein GOBAR_AA01763 [Gossypium barbadense]|uniref:Uncharacterized protein n=1 Tax=Gossypium barbadense TaxID=3634 RepID=A0A2P5YTA9_GOSBA|nr:hypothetical protein GOBAR_AA01763 [Gossypium barbadense]
MGWAQYYRLHQSYVLDLEEILIVRNVFKHCLLDLSLNRWRQIDADDGADTNTVGLVLAQFAWPHEADDELAFILLGIKAGANTLMLIVGGVGIAQGTEDSSEESISLSREIDEYIDLHSYM